jgi:hypothetical protein
MDTKLKDLISSWDGLLGEALLGEQGVVTTEDLWTLQLGSLVESAFAEESTGAAAEGVLIALEALDLLSPETLAAIQPATPDADLMRAVFIRAGLAERTASIAVAALSTLADHWTRHGSSVRTSVRAALADAARTVERQYPIEALRQIGFEAASVSAQKWAAWLVGATEWGSGSLAFAEKFQVTRPDLAEIADALDRSVERIDLVLSVGMDVWCDDCTPTEHPRCVDEADQVGVEVTCPLLARVVAS